RPFDLAQGVAWRAALVRIEPARHLLLLCLHHIAADGWSIEVLLREVTALYRACRDGVPAPLPELPVQYVDYAVWQRQELTGARLQALQEYWTRQLRDAPAVLQLPTD